jgi:hypothetical protein
MSHGEVLICTRCNGVIGETSHPTGPGISRCSCPPQDTKRWSISPTSAPALPPAARLLELEAEHQELTPDHTHRAFMHRVEARDSVEERCELLEHGIAKFKRGVAG